MQCINYVSVKKEKFKEKKWGEKSPSSLYTAIECSSNTCLYIYIKKKKGIHCM